MHCIALTENIVIMFCYCVFFLQFFSSFCLPIVVSCLPLINFKKNFIDIYKQLIAWYN